jgi:hypothetical protein
VFIKDKIKKIKLRGNGAFLEIPRKEKSLVLWPSVFIFFIAKREETKWTSVAFLLEEDNGEKS